MYSDILQFPLLYLNFLSCDIWLQFLRIPLLYKTRPIYVFVFSKFAESIPRKFGVRYDPYTQSINIIDSKHQVEDLVYNVNQEVQILMDALRKLNQ